MAEKIFRENAIRVFNLEEKLGGKLYQNFKKGLLISMTIAIL